MIVDKMKELFKEYDAYIGVYEALIAHGKEKEALDYLNQALEIKGNKAYDKMQKGRIYFLLGDATQALSLLEEAVEGKDYIVKDGDVILFKFNV